MEGQHHYGRGSGDSTARDAEVVLGTTAAARTGGGGVASDRRRETR
jgi:hypothetical protein